MGIPLVTGRPGLHSSYGRKRFFRSIWISDLHLGTRRCRAQELVAFLERHETEALYLVGDVVDGWVTGPTWHWDQRQAAVVRALVDWHRRGVRIVFLPGNHDEISVDLVQALLGPLPVVSELVHRTADGRRMLVTHGHQFDGTFNPNYWMHKLGAQAYHQALRVEHWYSEHGVAAPPGTVEASAYVKRYMAKTIRYLTDFADQTVLRSARHHRADGVICGHTHYPEHRSIGPITYINDGDWVKSCTAVVEKNDGSLALLHPGEETDGWCESAPTCEEAAS